MLSIINSRDDDTWKITACVEDKYLRLELGNGILVRC